MERQEFISKDPLTAKIVNLLSSAPGKSFSVEEIAEGVFANVTTKQVQMVISLLNKEGMVRTSIRDGRPAYSIK
jgi:hypothetical protein